MTGVGDGLPVGGGAEGGGGFEGVGGGVSGPGDLDAGLGEGDGEEGIAWRKWNGELGEETAGEGEEGTAGGGGIGFYNPSEELEIPGRGEVTPAEDMASEFESAAGTGLGEQSGGEGESHSD